MNAQLPWQVRLANVRSALVIEEEEAPSFLHRRISEIGNSSSRQFSTVPVLLVRVFDQRRCKSILEVVILTAVGDLGDDYRFRKN
jgi:hypothetical protein